MWAEPGNGLNMKVLWTDSPYAMQRVAGLHGAGQITERSCPEETRHDRTGVGLCRLARVGIGSSLSG
jgi:hypothetical protein